MERRELHQRQTSTASMVEAIVAAAGEPSARITTLGSFVCGDQVGEGTTLEAFTRAPPTTEK
jgi:hypothetical protein